MDRNNDKGRTQAPQQYSAAHAFREAAIIHHIDRHQFGHFTIGRRDYRTYQRLTAQRALFDPDSPAYKRLSGEIKRTYTQRAHYRLDRMPEIFKAIGAGIFGDVKHHDLWISQAHFYLPTRKIQNLASIGLLFVDLDYRYIPALAGRGPEEVLDLVLERCQATGIPEPSLVVASSPGGLQAKWLCEPLSPKKLPAWQDAQEQLTAMFRCAGADPRARDAARELRIVSSTHQESGAIVRVLHVAGGWSRPRQYRFEDLCRAIPPKPATAEVPEPRAYPEGLRTAGQSRRTLNWSRALDLLKLADFKGWTREPGPLRDVSLLGFLAAGCQAAARVNLTANDYHAEVVEIGRRLLLPKDWVEHGMEAIPGDSRSGGLARLREVRKGRPWWTPRNGWLITRFKIPVELRADTQFHIITKDEARERDRLRKEAERRAAGAVTRREYLDRAADRAAKARALHEAGYSDAEIGELMDRDRRVAWRWRRT